MTGATVADSPEFDERTLVRELTHRINSQLASAIDAVSAAAVRAEHPETKVALGDIAELLQEEANVHGVLAIPEGDALVDAAQYLRKLCLAMTRSRLQPIGVRLAFQADTLPLEPERCWRLGMALHELVTNSGRHACFDGRAGEINIKLSLAHPLVKCVIADNGSLSARLKPMRGLGLVRDLIKSLGGRLRYGFGAENSSFLLVFLLSDRERRANRVAALRRARAPRRLKASRLTCGSSPKPPRHPAASPSGRRGPIPRSTGPEAARLGAGRMNDQTDVAALPLADPALSDLTFS